ncbi:hypothetical protein LPJ61_005201 [Coemansia biformis]|uniref:BHLH domain-containing protein n=1 Tax=Coemansia biformis TaxID=1286918 RepID=A0A9W7Y767_9FUNG|nr:hypothetical protein LPJ61_005201 [Coemansia biformis]
MSGPFGDAGAPQAHTDDAILALNNLLSSIPSAASAHQLMAPAVTDISQVMPSFMAPDPGSAEGYLCAASAEMPGFGGSPLAANPVGITPVQSTQSLQLGDLDAAAALAVAGLTSMPLPTRTMAGTAIANSPSIAELDLAAILGVQVLQPRSAASDTFGLPTAPATAPLPQSGDILASLGGRMASGASSLAASRGYQDLAGDGMPIPMGVPLSKRVSMPVSFGQGVGPFGGGFVPAPARIALQRIASYNQGMASSAPSLAADPWAADSWTADVMQTSRPIGRANTTVSASGAASDNQQAPVQFHRKVAHNAIERRYRNNINDRISDLRNAVPALEHIRPKKRSSCSDDGPDSADEAADDASDAQVDGVEVATKLNKATILGKATEYIYYLRRANDQLRRESLYLQDYIRKLSDSGAAVHGIIEKARADSGAATAALYMPEPAPKPKRRKLQN